jgi:hypothetical protein
MESYSSYICINKVKTDVMQTKLKFFTLLITLFAFAGIDLNATQVSDTTARQNDTVSNPASNERPAPLNPWHRNVIKFNPTPMLLWGEVRNFTLSYERLIKNNQSLSLQLGYLVIPRVIDTIVGLVRLTDYARQGINVAFDYRYYPQFRNRRPAPDGLYLGGYLSYYGFKFTNNVEFLTESNTHAGTLKGTLQMVNLGLELGYQFIFWKRFSLDLLMFGPSLSVYSRQLELTGDLDKSDFEQIDEELAAKLLSRYPFLGYLFGGQTNTFSGSEVRLSTGFRYSVQIGFHF